MDNGHLNNAVYQAEELFKAALESSGRRRGSSTASDASTASPATEHPNNVGSRTVHQRYMPAMAKWMVKSAPPGADVKSWVYSDRCGSGGSGGSGPTLFDRVPVSSFMEVV